MTDYYHCSPFAPCDICEDEIMEEKAKVYNPLPDNVKPHRFVCNICEHYAVTNNENLYTSGLKNLCEECAQFWSQRRASGGNYWQVDYR